MAGGLYYPGQPFPGESGNTYAAGGPLGTIDFIGNSDLVVQGQIRGIAPERRYLYKIYDQDDNFLGIWTDVVSDFTYSQEINSAGSAITVTLARNSDSKAPEYEILVDDSDDPIVTDDTVELSMETETRAPIGASTTVDLNLNVRIYEFTESADDVEGDLVFTGYISRFKSQYGLTENTEVTIFSYGADLDNWLLTQDIDEDGTTVENTRVAYLSEDPSDIVRDILDKFTDDGGVIDYDGSSIDDTGTVVSYYYNMNTGLEALKKALELAPTDWYFYCDLATNLFHFHPRPSTPDHYFYLGKHIYNFALERSMEDIVNDVVFTGGKKTEVLKDNFFGADDTTLQDHIGDVNATWSKHVAAATGSIVLDQNRIRSDSTNEVIYVAGATTASNDYTVSADIRIFTVAAPLELLVRVNEAALTYYMGRIDASGNAQIYKVVSGSATQLGSVSVSPSINTTYPLEFSVQGSRLTLKFNRNTVLDVTDSDIPFGQKIGIRSASTAATGSTGMHLNNIRVTEPGGSFPEVFKRYRNTTSIDDYRRGLLKIQDNRVTDPESADIIAETEINRNKDPRFTSSITISSATYDTKSIKLGDLVGFRNFGNFVDTLEMQIVRIDYSPHQVVLQLDTLLPSVPKRLEDIKRNLAQSDVADNPDAPESETV